MYFRNYGLRKVWSDKCLKSRFSGGTLTHNMANGSKHCCNLSDSIFTVIINKCERNCVGKSLF